MENTNSITRFPITNFFAYDGKKYPINIDIFNCISNYFKNNHQKIEPNQEINLIDESKIQVKLKEEIIQDFINYCQNMEIMINNENAFGLHKLANMFDIHPLKEATEKYLFEQRKDFIEILLSKDGSINDNDKEQYEEIISNNLKAYISEDKLINLPIQTINRIVTKYQLKNKDINRTPEIIDFLFKCLDKYGREASVLFDKIDPEDNLGPNIFRLLLTEKYAKIFDFQYFQSRKLSDSIVQENFELKKENEEIKDNSNEIRKLIEKLNEQIAKLKSPHFNCPYNPEYKYKGIISYLFDSVSLSCGGFPNPSYPVTNIKIYDNNFFVNYFGNDAKSELDSWIEFDFGSSKKVDLESYLIRTDDEEDPSFTHPKSWRIMGSNDKFFWNHLDRRLNDTNLKGEFNVNHFICELGQYGNPCNRYRYIRFIQEDSWCYDDNDVEYKRPYNIDITYFELFGDIYYS